MTVKPIGWVVIPNYASDRTPLLIGPFADIDLAMAYAGVWAVDAGVVPIYPPHIPELAGSTMSAFVGSGAA